MSLFSQQKHILHLTLLLVSTKHRLKYSNILIPIIFACFNYSFSNICFSIRFSIFFNFIKTTKYHEFSGSQTTFRFSRNQTIRHIFYRTEWTNIVRVLSQVDTDLDLTLLTKKRIMSKWTDG